MNAATANSSNTTAASSSRGHWQEAHTATADASPNQQQQSGALLMPWSCSEDALLQLLKKRDPVGRGLEGVLVLRLLHRLLHWNPEQRPTARQALQHAYFSNAPRTVARQRGGMGRMEGGGDDVDLQQQQEQQQQHLDAAGGGGGAAGGRAVGMGGGAGRVADGLGSGTARGGSGVGPKRAAAEVRDCSSVPVGEPGWC